MAAGTFAAMSTRPIDHARLTEVSERFFAARPPRTPAEQAAYARLESEMIAAMGLTPEEFERMAAASRRAGFGRTPHRRAS
ncbi:hypothetical protein CHMI_03477 [Cellulomonas hominis]|nr:hypothetical protein CHMI_03477 [Cellulomonas hominis]